jgi:hypothetical protein
MGDPAENAALSLDHLKAHFLKFGKVRAHAVFGNEAVVAAIVGLAHRGVDADLGGHTGDDELLYPAILQDGMKIGGEKKRPCPVCRSPVRSGAGKVPE